MYATPVAYPLSYLKNKSFSWLIEYNPLSGVVEAFKYALFKKGELNIQALGYSTIFMIAVLLFGLFIFSKVERSFMDTV